MVRSRNDASAILTSVLLVLLGIEASRLAILKPFSIDELDYAHASWLVAGGAVPFRDFFDHHFPLLLQVLAPLWQLIGDDSTGIRWLRLAMLPFLALSAYATWRVSVPHLGPVAACLAPLFLLTTPAFVVFATEIRPDGMALALFLAATAALGRAPVPASRGWIAGALLALAVWGSQKVLFYGAGFALVAVVDLVRKPVRGPLLGSRLRFIASFGLVLGALIAGLASVGALSDWWFWCFRWPALHEAGPRRFGWGQALLPVLVQHPWLVALSIVGYWSVVARWRESPTPGTDLVLLSAFPLSFLSFALQDAPYAYSLLPFLALLALLSARAGATILPWLATRIAAARLRSAMAGAALLIVGSIGVFGLELRLREDNSRQIEFLHTVDRIIAPGEPIYANSGSAVARPHVGYFPFTNAWLRTTMAKKLSDEIPREILDEGASAWIRDIRFESLPAELRAFLEGSFVPYSPDLWLWGRRFDAPRDGPWQSEFVAIRDGEYFVWPGLAVVSVLTIDGQPVASERLLLKRGTHRIGVSAAKAPFFILKTLRRGETWQPNPGAPSFSRLFG